MSVLRRLSHALGGGGGRGGGGGGDAPDEETPHRHHHHHHRLHHHHHDKKDYTVGPTGGNIPLKEEEARRHRHRRRRSVTTVDVPKEKVPQPLREIDPGFESERSRPHERSSVSSDGTAGSGSSIASSGGVDIQGNRRNHGESPPPTPLIKTTPPTPSPLEQARRTDSKPVYRPPPPYPVAPLQQGGAEYIAFSPASNVSFQDGPQKRHSGSTVPRRFAAHPGAVEIGSSGSIVQEPKRVDSSSSDAPSPKTSTLRPDEKKASKTARRPKHRGSVRENQYDFLRTFDTVFVVDDSASMAGEYWDQLGQALETIATIATKYDSDGIDIHFLNSPQYDRKHVTSPTAVRDLFDSVQPAGITPTGACLDRILREYLDNYADAKAAYTPSSTSPGPHPTVYASLPKPLNILVLTDGEPTDDPGYVIVTAARNLDKLNAPLHQIGIQFVQIGNEEGAREALEELDDAIEEIYGIRDMVDFTPFVEAPGTGVSREMILKALLGAVNRRYDRWRNDF
ncbi:hypothetical protein C7212DRAFT_353420 [Tuber magnatum]|uniref:VWFA domain-containing protein n=1 Tax=Tuber magnatum TaxID=42249 RepID=A0A317SLC8_9PEZI|nr:hypothetical protein C7212DRAFT_353420 [Tuber magnatum]